MENVADGSTSVVNSAPTDILVMTCMEPTDLTAGLHIGEHIPSAVGTTRDKKMFVIGCGLVFGRTLVTGG
jgi:hypothetical protein